MHSETRRKVENSKRKCTFFELKEKGGAARKWPGGRGLHFQVLWSREGSCKFSYAPSQLHSWQKEDQWTN